MDGPSTTQTYRHKLIKGQQTLEFRVGEKRKLNLTDSADDEEIRPIGKKVLQMPPLPLIYQHSILETYRTKQYKECLNLIDELFKLSSSHPQYRSESARSKFRIIQAACWTMLDINKAKVFESLKSIIETDPNNSIALYALALAQYRDADLINCVKGFDAAMELNGSVMKKAIDLKAKAIKLRTLLLEADDNFKAIQIDVALQKLDDAAKVDPENSKILKIISSIRSYFSVKLIEQLERDLKRQFSELLEGKQLEEAKGLSQEIDKKEPEEEGKLLYLQGLAEYMKGGLDQSLELFRKAQEKHNDYLQKAKVMEMKTLELQELLNTGKENLEARKYEEAIETLTNALNVDTGNFAILQFIYLQRGLAHYNLRNFGEAFEDYKMFNSLDQPLGIDIVRYFGNKIAESVASNKDVPCSEKQDALKTADDLKMEDVSSQVTISIDYTMKANTSTIEN